MIVASTGPLRILYGVDIPIRRAGSPRPSRPLTIMDTYSTYSTYDVWPLVKKSVRSSGPSRVWLGATYGTIISFYILRRGGFLYVEYVEHWPEAPSSATSGPLRMAVSTP